MPTMIKLFAAPDKNKDFQGYMLHVLVRIWTTITGIIVLVGLYFFPEIKTRWISFAVLSLLIAVSSLSISQFYSRKFASWYFAIALWLYITIPCYTAGGIMAPGILSQLSVILTAGFLLNWRGGLLIGVLSMAADFFLVYLEMTGNLPTPAVVHTPLTRWIGAIIPFGTILALQYYATNHLRSNLIALQNEIKLREKAEEEKDKLVLVLKERVKELKILYQICQILQEDEKPLKDLFQQIATILPLGWQYPELASARLTIKDTEYVSANFAPSKIMQSNEASTITGLKIKIEIFYAEAIQEKGETLFLKEEDDLIKTLLNFLKIEIDRRERMKELKDYKFALDVATLVSIADAAGQFTYVNDNFCQKSKYAADELIGESHKILWSGYHSADYFEHLKLNMENGTPFSGEFCNKAADGSLYWVYSSIIPFVNEQGKVYQYLSINQDISEKKEAEEQSRKSDQNLRKITSHSYGNSYMFEIEESGKIIPLFMSRGTDAYNHDYELTDLIDNPNLLLETVVDEDKAKFIESMKTAYKTKSKISVQYRINVQGTIRWRWMQASPELESSGQYIWYGSTSDITPIVDYISAIEQILFDISHVMRRPIANIIGIISMFNKQKIDEEEIKSLLKLLESVGLELEKFTSELNREYNNKRQNPQFNLDLSSQLDKRASLFPKK